MTDAQWLNKTRGNISLNGQRFKAVDLSKTKQTTIKHMNTSVAALRQSGNKVKVCHSRYIPVWDGEQFTLQLIPIREIKDKEGNLKGVWSKGGSTVVEIDTPDGKKLQGTAQCNLADSFNRKIALRIALGRAFKNA